MTRNHYTHFLFLNLSNKIDTCIKFLLQVIMYVYQNHTFSDSYNLDDAITLSVSNTHKTRASYPRDYSEIDSKSDYQIPSGIIVILIILCMCSISKCLCICMLWTKKQSLGQ